MEASVRMSQEKRLFKALQTPKTMLMASVETGILRANICRYVSELRKRDAIKEVKVGICPISKHRATFLTTNI